jgi:hypothetical protein
MHYLDAPRCHGLRLQFVQPRHRQIVVHCLLVRVLRRQLAVRHLGGVLVQPAGYALKIGLKSGLHAFSYYLFYHKTKDKKSKI